MLIADNIIKDKIKNVYFIWGRGKTTIANELSKKYGYFIYSTDDSRNWHMKAANPDHQPFMCRNLENEYGVKCFWELPQEIIEEREQHFVSELTPMIIADLIMLAPQYEVIICEGDIDYEAVIPVSSHKVHLCNCGTNFDWFNRPDHDNILDLLKSRTDITEKEKENIISKAYNTVSQNEGQIPDWVNRYCVKNIIWDDNTRIEQTAFEVEQYFQFAFSN